MTGPYEQSSNDMVVVFTHEGPEVIQSEDAGRQSSHLAQIGQGIMT